MSTPGTSAQWVVPEQQGTRYVWRAGSLVFAVDGGIGARITEAGLDGRNVLIGPEVNSTNHGSTVWTSPQSVWNWPPPAELDEGPYDADRDGGKVVFTSAPSASLGVRLSKTFGVSATTGAFESSFSVRNMGTTDIQTALWQVSRVHTGGLSFFSEGEGGIYPPSLLTTVQRDGCVWFPYRSEDIHGHQKLFADSAEGWLAHVVGGSNGHAPILFLKTFPTVPRRNQAPDEALVEIYADPGHTYVEVEVQSAYSTIAPGAAFAWNVRWSLHALPDGLDPFVGNAALIAFVRGCVRRL